MCEFLLVALVCPPRVPHTEADVELQVTLTVSNPTASDAVPKSRFPKSKQYGWWLVVGEADGSTGAPTSDLLALKRVSVRGPTLHRDPWQTAVLGGLGVEAGLRTGRPQAGGVARRF